MRLDFLSPQVGGPGSDAKYSTEYVDKLRELPNVKFLGFVPPDQIGQVYEDAKLHLSTSDWEGFPNAFLYSWIRGVPTCSMNINPDQVVSHHELGIVDPGPVFLANKMEALLKDEDRYNAMARRCHDHVIATNSRDLSVEAFIKDLP